MEHENIVWRFLNKMTDLLMLNLLFLMCSVPVVTIGASLSAMYAVNLRSIRYGDGYVVKVFFKSFKQCFKQATLAWLLFCVFGGVLYLDYRFWQQTGGNLAKTMSIMSLAIAIVSGIVFLWLYPVIAKMQDAFIRQVKNAAAMAVGYLVPQTAICMGLSLGFFYAIYTNFAAMVVLLMVGCSVLTYIQSFFFYQVFAKFITETPASEEDPLYAGRHEMDAGKRTENSPEGKEDTTAFKQIK